VGGGTGCAETKAGASPFLLLARVRGILTGSDLEQPKPESYTARFAHRILLGLKEEIEDY
jgi:hypothetical protein